MTNLCKHVLCLPRALSAIAESKALQDGSDSSRPFGRGPSAVYLPADRRLAVRATASPIAPT